MADRQGDVDAGPNTLIAMSRSRAHRPLARHACRQARARAPQALRMPSIASSAHDQVRTQAHAHPLGRALISWASCFRYPSDRYFRFPPARCGMAGPAMCVANPGGLPAPSLGLKPHRYRPLPSAARARAPYPAMRTRSS